MYRSDDDFPFPTVDDVAISETPDGLAAIVKPHVALALWPRPTLPAAMALDLDSVDDLTFVLSDGGEDAVVAAARLIEGGYPDDAAATIGADIAMLAAIHRRLTPASAIAVRLDVIEGDACSRFHADYVSLRMLCTYRGAATQWCRVGAAETVHDLAPGTVGIFKGRLVMEAPVILHRSPPLRVSGGQRLLLVLDPG